jgi:malonate-semialdehyde dehydrogenase (acetylating)/methylmalonate-semialdehyde dehydrogenase
VEDVAIVELADARRLLPPGLGHRHAAILSPPRYAGISTKEAGMTEVAEQFTEKQAGGEIGRISHWIDGAHVEGSSGRSGPVYNPATGVQSGEVDFASPEEVDAAVKAAQRALEGWRAVSLSRRTELFFRIRKLVDEHREDIARILTLEHGKVLSDAKGEVARGLEVIEFCCGIPELLKGGYSEQASTGIDVYSIRQPLGVAAGITPFNFPAMVPMWMWAPAIACGNTFVLKPSEKDPSASIFTAELLKEAGLPDGVFNVVHGDKVTVDAILEHPGIAAVSFVGSTPIARYVYETGTSHDKRVQALGGAKNHMVVLPDADIEMAADAAVSAGYGSAGERCMAVSMLVAVGHAADDLVEAIKARLPDVRVGDGMDPDSEMGPLVTREHRDKVASYIEKGGEEGATIVTDGRETAPDGGGFFLGVTLLDDVKPEMDVYKDEIFGPVLGVTRVDTYDEAVKLVNENPYGNGVALFTRDGGVARQFQFDVNVGMVGINVPIPVPVAYYSFGGWKSSLFGDLHIYGPDGIQFYTQGKVVTSRWPDPATSKVDLGFPQTR